MPDFASTFPRRRRTRLGTFIRWSLRTVTALLILTLILPLTYAAWLNWRGKAAAQQITDMMAEREIKPIQSLYSWATDVDFNQQFTPREPPPDSGEDEIDIYVQK
ncbi:hypothetical protein [Mucisphaera sp.]|uniref:hypothetical protein n=1 Tax=Mucisphaera sp. TaxID=2913024 RepID=UPI003D11C089